jgi:NitT/TauT family transport system substrate-binding protein
MMNRREVVRDLALVGAASAAGISPCVFAAEAPPETKKIRISWGRGGLCVAPQYVADELLKGEGFTDVEYVKNKEGIVAQANALAAGEIDMLWTFVAPLIMRVDTGAPIVMLAGGHVGCFELFGTDQVRSIRDLKGKSVAVSELGRTQHVFLASMLAYVGLDPRKDVHFVEHSSAETIQLFTDGKIDAFLGFPPEPQELRSKKIGHVIVNSATDRPWSQYFCCMVTGNREFVQRNPVATKRAVRAMLKAADVCASEPERAARSLVEKGIFERYDYALQTMQDVVYNKWRIYNPEDTVRFYALRLQEAGMIKSNPQRIIAQGTDWRFLNELKRELKS